MVFPFSLVLLLFDVGLINVKFRGSRHLGSSLSPFLIISVSLSLFLNLCHSQRRNSLQERRHAALSSNSPFHKQNSRGCCDNTGSVLHVECVSEWWMCPHCCNVCLDCVSYMGTGTMIAGRDKPPPILKMDKLYGNTLHWEQWRDPPVSHFDMISDLQFLRRSGLLLISLDSSWVFRPCVKTPLGSTGFTHIHTNTHVWSAVILL